MTAALVLISTADTDLLAARASGADWRVANPARLEADAVPALIDGAGAVVVRLLGGRRTWPEGLDAVLASGLPVIALGGETTPDAELTALSTVPAGVAHDALRYLVEGGPDNLRELHRFVSDTVLLTGEGFEAPAATPAFGVHGDPAARPGARPPSAWSSTGRTRSAGTPRSSTRCARRCRTRGVNALPVFVPLAAGGERRADRDPRPLRRPGGHRARRRRDPPGRRRLRAATPTPGPSDALAALDIPVVQGLCLTGSLRAVGRTPTPRLSPMDAAMQVAIPEFDGRLISVPFSFKQDGPDGIGVYVADAERAARVAGIAVGYARLRHIPNADKRLAIVLSSYPTKHARVGNAVGLDTPASAVALIAALKDAGYDIGDTPTDGDALIHTLIAGGRPRRRVAHRAAARERPDPGAGRASTAAGSTRSIPLCGTVHARRLG